MRNFVTKVIARARTPRHTGKRLWAMFLIRTRLCNLLTIQIQDYRIKFHPAAISGAFFVDPNDRVQDYVVIRRQLRPGDTYVDVGANVGTTVIPAAMAVGPQGKVYAYEPHPRIASFLQENIIFNGLTNVTVKQCAIDKARGEVFLTDASMDDTNSIADRSQPKGISVRAYSLDELLLDVNEIALMKVDVEGAELRVIAGARATIMKTQALYIEVSKSALGKFGNTVPELIENITAMGYTVYRIVNHHTLREVSIDGLLAKTHSNVLALRQPLEFAHRHGIDLG